MLGGIFIGGRSSRMGGFPKGLLRLPSGETLIARTLRVLAEAGLEPILVGDAPDVALAVAEHVRRIDDVAAKQGPLGGLVALLEAARGANVLAVACDMPRLDGALVRRLRGEAPEAIAVAPRRGAVWEPLCARYDASRALPIAAARLAAGQLALQGLLDALSAASIDVVDERALVDVDTFHDAAREGLERLP